MEKMTAARIALESLLPQSRLSAGEIEARLKQALSPAYWKDLCPRMSMDRCMDLEGDESQALGGQEQGALCNQLMREGYFQTRSLLPDTVTMRMRECVEILRREGWPPFFTYVYAEFWQAVRIPALRQVLTSALGEGYRQVSHVITHYVKPGDGVGSESGWHPHIDFCEVGDRLTVWVALSDATLTNGCMYLIPKTKVSESVLDDFKNMRPIETNELRRLLHGTRALPVSAGTMLCWEHNVIHWGSQARPGSEPRISFSVVFLKKQAVPLDIDLPLLEINTLPGFEERLRAIGRGILYYQVHHLVVLGRFAGFAERLLVELKKESLYGATQR